MRLFNANQVRYLVIGGYALVQYAEPRYTKDLDLWISTDTYLQLEDDVRRSLTVGRPISEQPVEQVPAATA